MNLFKATNIRLATSLDWNARRIVKRAKGDGKLIRRYARRKIGQLTKDWSSEDE